MASNSCMMTTHSSPGGHNSCTVRSIKAGFLLHVYMYALTVCANASIYHNVCMQYLHVCMRIRSYGTPDLLYLARHCR